MNHAKFSKQLTSIYALSKLIYTSKITALKPSIRNYRLNIFKVQSNSATDNLISSSKNQFTYRISIKKLSTQNKLLENATVFNPKSLAIKCRQSTTQKAQVLTSDKTPPTG